MLIIICQRILTNSKKAPKGRLILKPILLFLRHYSKSKIATAIDTFQENLDGVWKVYHTSPL